MLGGLALVAIQDQSAHGDIPLLEPLLLADRSIRLSAVGVGDAPGPFGADDGVPLGHEEEDGPGEEPEEGEVEEPADPRFEPPAVDGVRRVDVDVAVFHREADLHVAAVVGCGDHAFESVLQVLLVQAGDGAAEPEDPEHAWAGAVAVTPFCQCRLRRADFDVLLCAWGAAFQDRAAVGFLAWFDGHESHGGGVLRIKVFVQVSCEVDDDAKVGDVLGFFLVTILYCLFVCAHNVYERCRCSLCVVFDGLLQHQGIGVEQWIHDILCLAHDGLAILEAGAVVVCASCGGRDMANWRYLSC